MERKVSKVTNLKFSIIVPIYNRELCVHPVVESVLSQNYVQWELILIDDGSNDNTGKICLSYAEKDNRIRYYYQKNGGVCVARNNGLKHAVGDYILFLDSDNTLKPDALKVLYECLAVNLQTDIVCYGYSTSQNQWLPSEVNMDVNGEEIRKKYLPTHINIYFQTQDFLQNYVWNKCYKRDFLIHNSIRFDEKRRTWEDGQFVVNCLDKAKNMILLSEALYNAEIDVDVEHLSSKLYEDQLFRYISDEEDYKNRFDNEFDFTNEHYCRSNFNVLNILCTRMAAAFPSQAKHMIREALAMRIVVFWSCYVVPENLFEKKLRNYILSGKTDKATKLFGTDLIAKVIRQVLLRLHI